jgi:hypothetical protein
MISSSANSQIEFGIKGGLNFNYANNETYLIEGWKIIWFESTRGSNL